MQLRQRNKLNHHNITFLFKINHDYLSTKLCYLQTTSTFSHYLDSQDIFELITERLLQIQGNIAYRS